MSDDDSVKDLEKFLENLTFEKFGTLKFMPVAVEKGGMARKLEGAAPYNIFLTAIKDSKPTHQEPLTITMQEIFDESLGKIESSVQINYEIDLYWLLAHYQHACIL